MFNKLSNILRVKFARKDGLSRQLEIVRVFDIYRQEIKKIFPNEENIKLISLRNKILNIGVSSSVLASELRMRQQEVVEKINSALGAEKINRIIYRF